METINMIDSLVKKAQSILQQTHKNGEEFMPAAFALKDGKIVEVIGFPFYDEEEKIEAYRMVGRRCSELDCSEVILVVDSLYREMNDEENTYVGDNWDTEKPSAYPESMQKHCLVFNRIDFHNGTELRLMKYRVDHQKVIIEGVDTYQQSDGELAENVAFGFTIEEAKKLSDNPDDGIAKVREKYELLRG